MTMEEFLRKHFDCKRPFRAKPVRLESGDGRVGYEYLTESGMRAYGRFIEMLYDFSELCKELEVDLIDQSKVENAVDDFDEFVSSEHY